MTEETFRNIFQAEAEGQGRRSRVPPSLDAQSDGAGGDSDVQERISAIERAASALQADVFFLSGPINRNAAERLREAHGSSSGRERCLLILSTSGGDADAAYLMARFLRGVYKHLTICVLGYCKSAGTLLALGGHEVSMGLLGELGPLDVQISKKDELVQSGSGLDIFISLNVLAETAFSSFFQRYLVNIIGRSEGQISTKTAADIATKLTVGMVAPIAAQIDPMRLGRERRAMDIASAYAERLGTPAEAIARLTTAYPDHGFVIDLAEAKELLPQARGLNPAERALEAALASTTSSIYVPSHEVIVACLTKRDDHPVAQPSTPAKEEQVGVQTDSAGDPGKATSGDRGVRSPSDGAHGPVETSASSVPPPSH